MTHTGTIRFSETEAPSREMLDVMLLEITPQLPGYELSNSEYSIHNDGFGVDYVLVYDRDITT
jgi:hypothetical protein